MYVMKTRRNLEGVNFMRVGTNRHEGGDQRMQ